ncbi:hypothetical protein TNCV_3023741 [Trichonephila clavipes]|nr:hypothetical protein TNCV_3023741 [Trichonephila clavipes]
MVTVQIVLAASDIVALSAHILVILRVQTSPHLDSRPVMWLQELTIDELRETHEQKQGNEELESLDRVQSEYRMMVTEEVNPPGKPPSPSGSQEGFNYNHQTTHNATTESGPRNEINQLSSTDPKLPPSSTGKRKDVQQFQHLL